MPEPPAMPSEARKHTEAGAVAFADHYVDLLNYATTTGDTKAARALSMKACRDCHGILDTIDEIYGAGGWVKGGEWRVWDRSVTRNNPKSFAVGLKIRSSPQKLKRNKNARIQQGSGGDDYVITITVEWRNAEWRVWELYREQPGS